MEKPHNFNDAEGEEIIRCLRSYGVLTHNRLRERVGADEWRESTFENCLSGLVRRGRVIRLGDELYELSDDERTPVA
jgi:hypothetical protein